jgi:hypothetical protein
MHRQIHVPDRIDTVMKPVQSSRIDQNLDPGARIPQELLKLADRDNPMLPPSELRQTLPPLRST